MHNNAIQRTVVQTTVTDFCGGASTTSRTSATIWVCPHPSDVSMAHVRFGGSMAPNSTESHSQVVRKEDCLELVEFFCELAIVLAERETKKDCC